MELKEFITQTNIQITDGLREGHKYVQDNNLGKGVSDSMPKEINFDIAVSSSEEEKTGIGGKISVASILSLGANNEATFKASNVSRIQFKIFVNVSSTSK